MNNNNNVTANTSLSAQDFSKLLFSEFRVLEATNSGGTISQKGLKLAFLDQENIRALGYDLKESALLKLAEEYSVDSNKSPLYKKIMEFEPEIEVSPMYPNFPQQVIEMSEVEFRVNQLLHYASTYGVKAVFGIEVTQGWLPKTEEIQERGEDKQLLKLKTLDYLSPIEIQSFVVNKVIGKKERLLPKELEVAKYIALGENAPTVEDIPFKENIFSIYGDAILNSSPEKIKSIISSIKPVFKHPGDVLDLLEYLVVKNRFKHFNTSTKRAFVQLIESFSEGSIEENLASNRWSKHFLGKGKKRRSMNKNIVLIDYLSFSRFSKNPKAMEIVNQMKNGELVSWNQELELAYLNGEVEKARALLLQRPGMYFRQINRLFKNGIDSEVLSEDVAGIAPSLKTQSIVSALNNYDKEIEVSEVFYNALISNLASKDIQEVKGKKVFIEQSDVDLEKSRISILEKAKEGGYLQNGMAIKIPEDVKTLRFFTYWNDKKRIDIDLHASYLVSDGEDTRKGHVGFYGHSNDLGVTHSGDITHSDAAEYVDIELETARRNGVKRIQFNINSFTGVPFKNIETVFAGMMGVSELKQNVKLYSGKNVFFRNDLTSDSTSLDYAFIDLENRLLYILGGTSKVRNDLNLEEKVDVKLSIQGYLHILLASQGAEVVQNKEEAEVVLGLAKADEDNYFSLIDENYFMGK